MKKLLVAVAVVASVVGVGARPVLGNTPTPTAVTIAGDLQSELGCPGDWDPACAATHLTYDASDDVWQGTWSVPAGSWNYKAALNDSWDENYGAHAQPNGANIPLNLASQRSVKFYYDHKSHWVTDNVNSVIAVAPGSFQSELGCPGDWDPSCLRSWLQDPDGDGTYTFETTALPAGSYETKVAINEAWDENYGAGGVPDGANIPFTVSTTGQKVTFQYVASTHVLTILAGQSVSLGSAKVWLGLKNGDDIGTRFDVKAEVLQNGSTIGSGTAANVSPSSSSFAKALQRTFALAVNGSPTVQAGDTFGIRVSVRIACGVSGHASGRARLFYQDGADSNFGATFGSGSPQTFYLRSGNALASSSGTPIQTADVLAKNTVACSGSGRSYTAIGTWTTTVPA